MSAQYHLSDELLLSYSAGTLDEASSLLVATHLALCPHCRSRNLAADAIVVDGQTRLPKLPVCPAMHFRLNGFPPVRHISASCFAVGGLRGSPPLRHEQIHRR